MKRAGIILLIILIFYNVSFALCYNTLFAFNNKGAIPKTSLINSDVLSFDISDDSLYQPFLLDSEFSNISAHYSCFDSELNLNLGHKAIHLLDLSAGLFVDIREVISTSILITQKFFIPGYRLSNLLDNQFSFRV